MLQGVQEEMTKDKFLALVLKEGNIGAGTALVAWVWYGNPFLGLGIGRG